MRPDKVLIWRPIVIIAALNIVLILGMLFMATSQMATPAGVVLTLNPPANVSKEENQVHVMISSENVIYVDEKVMTLNELRRILAAPRLKGGHIYLRADKRASVGRLMDVFKLCQGIINGQVHVSAMD